MKKLKITALCLVFVLAALLLSGCIKMHISVVWNEDNSATISVTSGILKTALEMLGSTEEEMQEQLKEGLDLDDGEYTFKELIDSEYVGIIATTKVDDITKDSSESLDTLTFRCEENGKKKTYTVSGRFDGSDLTGDDDEMEEMGLGADSFDMKLIIEMPGKITSNNATEQKGNTLTWVLDAAGTTVIQATSEGGSGGGSLLLWIILAVLVVVLIGIIVAILVLSKKSKAPAQAEAPAYGAPVQPQYAPPGYGAPAQPQQQYAPPPAPPQYAPPEQPPQYAPPEPPPQYAPPEPPPQYAPPEPQPQYAPPEPPPQYAPPEPPPQYAPPEPPPQYAPPPVYTAPAQEAPPAALKCARCGAEMPVGSKFCTACGAPFEN